MGYGYSYNYDYGMSDSVFAAFMSIYLIIFMVALIFWIVEYVFFAIGLYTIAKRMGKNYPWLAFIPFARKYLHGELAGTIKLKAKKIKNPGIWKLVLPIISGAVFSFFMIIIMIAFGIGTFMGMSAYGYGVSGGTILLAVVLLLIMAVAAVLYQAVYRVLCVLVDVRIYERFTTHNMGIAHAVISALIPLYEACCLFAMRNKEFNPGMEPELPPPPAPLPPVYPGNPVPPAAGQQAPFGPAASENVSPADVSSTEEMWKPEADAESAEPAKTEASAAEKYTYASAEPGSDAPAPDQTETEAPVQESGSEDKAEQQNNDNMF